MNLIVEENLANDIADREVSNAMYKALNPLDEYETYVEHNERMKLKRVKEYAMNITVSSIIQQVRYYYKYEHKMFMAFKERENNGISQEMFDRMKSMGVIE